MDTTELHHPIILLETRKQGQRFSFGTENGRRAVVYHIGIGSHLIDEHHIRSQPVSHSGEKIVTFFDALTRVFARTDIYHCIRTSGTFVRVHDVLSDHNSDFPPGDLYEFAPPARIKKRGVVALKDMLSRNISDYLAVLDESRSTDRPPSLLYGKPHQSRNAVAAGRYLDKRLLAKVKKIHLVQQIVGRRPAYRLFSEHHQVGAVGLGSLDGIHDFEFVVFESSDGII